MDRSAPTRAFALLVLAGVVAATCVALGFWQLDRLDQRRAANARIQQGLRASPLTLAGAPGPRAAYRRATATGVYDASSSVVLYGRTLDGRPGDHLLTPLRLDDGSAVLVDRGWVPVEGTTTTPPGTVRVSGILLPPESTAGEAPADGRVLRVDVVGIASVLPYELGRTYLLLRRQDPPASGFPEPVSLPEPSQGPHLSYAIQWFSFAAIALVGGGVLARRDRRAGAERAASGEE